MNASADGDAETLRISTDTEETVNIGDYSGHGRPRGPEPVRARDHDMRMKEKLIPGGIPEPVSGRAFLFFTGSCETGDFMVDGFFLRRNGRKHELSDVRRPVINMDNGPECSGRRTQFLPRLTEFADATGLIIRLVYYPPYHSRYNAIGRYRAGPGKSWNGYLPDTAETVSNRSTDSVRKGLNAAVRLLKTSYQKGIGICGKEKAGLEERLQRSDQLPLYDITNPTCYLIEKPNQV